MFIPAHGQITRSGCSGASAPRGDIRGPGCPGWLSGPAAYRAALGRLLNVSGLRVLIRSGYGLELRLLRSCFCVSCWFHGRKCRSVKTEGSNLHCPGRTAACPQTGVEASACPQGPRCASPPLPESCRRAPERSSAATRQSPRFSETWDTSPVSPLCDPSRAGHGATHGSLIGAHGQMR